MEYQCLLSIICAVLLFAGESKNIFPLKIQRFSLKSYFRINIMFSETCQCVYSRPTGICSTVGMVYQAELDFLKTESPVVDLSSKLIFRILYKVLRLKHSVDIKLGKDGLYILSFLLSFELFQVGRNNPHCSQEDNPISAKEGRYRNSF